MMLLSQDVALQDFTPEESSRLGEISQRFDRVPDERAFTDCVAVIRQEYGRKENRNTEDDLMALSRLLKQDKGYGGT